MADDSPFDRCLWPDCVKPGSPVLCLAHRARVPGDLRKRLHTAVVQNNQPAWRAAMVELRTVAATA